VRQRGAVRRAFTGGIRSTVAMLSMIAPGGSSAAQREKAIATLAGLVGAVTLARAADDPTISDEILDVALATFGGKSGRRRRPSKPASGESLIKRRSGAYRKSLPKELDQ
jgi:TetR/AcrR family transcriptional repressor of nem operon